KRADTRCTPMKFRKVYDKLSPQKRALIDEIGLGAFQHLPSDLFEKKPNEFEKKLNDEEKEALNLFKGKTFTFVENMVKECPIENEEEKRTFKRAFTLFIQRCFLLPTSTHYISPIHLPVIRDIGNTRERNWAHHVHSFLMAGIKDFQDKGTQAVKGCHFVL
ncbi:hypothetical protein PIB30_084434, partial [Stylosanthes scabra]|nr:hypothetical protein [Stylosanthes scabra]